MLLVLLLVIALMAVPISFEIYKNGEDNILSRAGAEIIASRKLKTWLSRQSEMTVSVRNAFVAAGALIATFAAFLAGETVIRGVAVFGMFSINAILH